MGFIPVTPCLLGKRQSGGSSSLQAAFSLVVKPTSSQGPARAGSLDSASAARLFCARTCVSHRSAGVAQLVEHLICNEVVGGSSPFASLKVSRRPRRSAFPFVEGFPSGQREQTVNLSAMPSEVRILPPPPFLNPGATHRRRSRVSGFHRTAARSWIVCTCRALSGNSSVVERQPSKLRVAGSNPVSRSIILESSR